MDIFQLRERLQLKEVSGGTIGEVDGYYFSLYEGKIGALNGQFLAFTFNQTVTSADVRVIRKESKQLFFLQTSIRKNDSIFVFVPKKIKNVDKFVGGVLKIINGFLSARLRQSDQCFVCGGKNEFTTEKAEVSVRNGFALKCHPECVDKYNKHLDQEEVKETANNNKLPISILLTVIGAIVGLFPNLIALYGFEMMFGYGFALIPLGAFYGFKLGGAPLRKASTTIIVTTSMLTAVAMAFLYVFTICSWTGYSLGELFSMDEVLPSLVKDLLFMFVFTGLGISICWRLITNADRPKHL